MNECRLFKRLIPALALIISAVGVAAAVIFVRISEVDPSATLMLRMFCASVLMGISGTLSARNSKAPPGPPALPTSKIRLLLVISSLVACLDLLSNHWAVVHTSVANTTLLMNLSPAFVALFSYLIFREWITLPQCFSLAVALLGAGLLVVESHELSLGSSSLVGDGLAVLSALLYAIYLILTKQLRSRIETRKIIFWNSAIAAAALLPLVLATSDSVLPVSFKGYAVIFALAIVSQLLGHGLMAYALRHVPAGLASMTVLSRPLISALLAWMFLSESMTSVQLIGAGLILAGVFTYHNSSWIARSTAWLSGFGRLSPPTGVRDTEG